MRFPCVQGFVNSSRARDFNISETSFNSMIKDSLSGPLSCLGGLCPRVTPNVSDCAQYQFLYLYMISKTVC